MGVVRKSQGRAGPPGPPSHDSDGEPGVIADGPAVRPYL
jgi:hypothetical protein